MNQFDIFRNPDRSERDTKPYLVVLQHNHMHLLPSLLVAPLVPAELTITMARLSPEAELEGRRFKLHIYDLATFSRRYFKAAAVGSLKAQRDAIVSALDMLFTGV